jgi:hypothetical protein
MGAYQMAQRETPAQRLSRLAQKPTAAKTTQMKFRMSNYLHDEIEEAAGRNGWGASEEIRRRLEASFLGELQAGDGETYQLLEAIKAVTGNMPPAFGFWHENRFAFEVLRIAIKVLLDFYRPPGDPIRPSDNEIADLYLGENGTPETAGRMLAGGAAVAANIPIPRAGKAREPSEVGEGE